MIDKRIGKRIKDRRKSLGFTQEQLSEKIDIAPHYLSMIERGESFPRYEILIDLLNVLEVSADYVFQDVLTCTAQYRASELWEKVQALDEERRRWVLESLENMIKSSK
ncbi:MAG: helix-turn-helix transcriptional regulator [Clostridia bacterium]|nr:helix-turn-helix transcriptional regulator [Clostridia bacterium]